MNIICVDDEKLVLGLNVSLCQELKQKPDVEGFTDADEAISYLKNNKVDVAILDINMPQIDGINLAIKVKSNSPDTSVIFLTGYDNYAVDAFRVHASGYLMKPISKERLQEEIDYVTNSSPIVAEVSKPQVKTFGEFDLFKDGKTVKFSRSKAKELLAFLVDRQGSSVSRATAYSVIWEDDDYDRSKQKQLDVIIRSLKDTLKENAIENIIDIKGGQMRVVPENFDCDLYRFFDKDVNTINAYRGEYMSSYSWASLTEAYMDRIHNKNETIQSNSESL